jgi:hypothetical protein
VTEGLHSLAERIRVGLVELESVLNRAEEGWQRVLQTSDDFYLDGVALNLHGFYSGLERLFELIATIVDGSRPLGENWHQTLLQQMAGEVPEVRPAVISETALTQLDEFRGFRHVVRNVYTYKFDPAKIEKLIVKAPQVFYRVRVELLAFADFLEHQA